MTYQDIVNIIRNAANYVNPNGFFIHGRKTDGSLNYNETTPQILLLEPQPNTNINNNSFVETITFPIVFVTQDSPESTELRREDLKQEMYLLSRKLLAKIDEEPLLQNVQFTGGQPEIRQLSGTLTGFSYSLEITYPLSECSLYFDLPPTIKLFATETVVASGTHVQIGWIAENVNSVNITPFGVLQGQFGFVNVTINNTKTFIGTATNDAGTDTDSLTISVSSGCADATAELFDTNGNLLSATPIASGATEAIIAPDATILINGDNSFPTIPSGGLENIVVENTAGTPVGAYDGNTNSWVTPEITVTDSDGSTFTQPSVTDVVCTPVTPLTVDFSVNDTTPDTNQTVTFTDLTAGATQWLWDFGDGNLSTLQNPTHQYKTTGTYTVTLCAGNGTNAGREVKTNYITVSLEAELTTNLFASYNANDWVNDGSGNASQWNDSSGNGFHITNGGAANRPQILTNQLNGFGGLSFNGVNQWLQNNDALMSISDCTYYIVFERKRVTSEVLLAAFSSVNYRAVVTNTTEMAYRLRQVTQGGWVSYGNNVNRYVIGGFRFANVNGAIQFFGLQSYEGILINPSNIETGLYLCRNGLGSYQQAIVSEVKVYNVAHTAAQMNQVIQRLSAKFNKYD
jgi:PKD repeat protein